MNSIAARTNHHVEMPIAMRILIADDSALFRLLLNKLLTDMGYEVIVCEDGRAACDILLQDNPPPIAILDWMMPEMDGLQVCEEIRTKTDRPYIYMLLLTSKNTKEDLLRAFDAGFDDFLTKPVDADELKVRLRAAQRILAWQDQLAPGGRIVVPLRVRGGVTRSVAFEPCNQGRAA